MITFNERRDRVIFEYEPEDAPAWVWAKLQSAGGVTIGKVFRFRRADLLTEPNEAQLEGSEEFAYRFKFARREGDYWRIKGRYVGSVRPVQIARDIALTRKLFVAHRDISIFRRISGLVDAGTEIVIGGPLPGAVPQAEFEHLLAKFPNTTELDRYANARVADVLGEYFDGMKDARQHYEDYMSRRKSILEDEPLDTDALLEVELEKYLLIRRTIADWLGAAEMRTERDWQRLITTFLLLIFPKYIAVLQNVRIPDSYPIPGASGRREIDIALLDAAGNLDVIEIKRPYGGKVLANAPYRKNGVPSHELSGTIMQAEKYLFHLSKWGAAGERALTRRYAADLPPGIEIRITNPKAIVILGRDRASDGTSLLDPSRQQDFEIIRRKYANMMDVMTYDDLLRRLDNVIASLRRRIGQPRSG